MKLLKETMQVRHSSSNFSFFNLFFLLKKGQACWILNGFWDELQGEAETIYQLWQKMVSLDIQNKKEGRDLDEFYVFNKNIFLLKFDLFLF